MASGIYNRFLGNLMKKAVHLETDTVKVALMGAGHTFTNTHATWADVSANEVTGIGYIAGGQELTGKTVTEAVTTKWDATDVSWSGATITASHAVIYDTTASNNLIASIDFGGAQAVNDGIFTVQWSANGIITLAE